MKLRNNLTINKKEINFVQTLQCGQIFSYKINAENIEIYSANHFALVRECADCYMVECDDKEYWVNFFDVTTDYGKIKRELAAFEFLKPALEFGGGIRILKQDILEVIISFAISANNHINRITNTLFKMREMFGTQIDGYYAFPTLSQLQQISEEDFKIMGAGYRSGQLVKLINQLATVDYLAWKQLPTEQLQQNLLQLSGVGEKVADCIMLFGYNRVDVFPVDTWIEKVHNDYFPPQTNRKLIRKNMLQLFQRNAGYAQQYLFYYKRESEKKHKKLNDKQAN